MRADTHGCTQRFLRESVHLQEEEREMKYRRYYQRVLKDRLTALRKVRHAAVCSNDGTLESVCDIAHTVEEARTPEARAVPRLSY